MCDQALIHLPPHHHRLQQTWAATTPAAYPAVYNTGWADRTEYWTSPMYAQPAYMQPLEAPLAQPMDTADPAGTSAAQLQAGGQAGPTASKSGQALQQQQQQQGKYGKGKAAKLVRQEGKQKEQQPKAPVQSAAAAAINGISRAPGACVLKQNSRSARRKAAKRRARRLGLLPPAGQAGMQESTQGAGQEQQQHQAVEPVQQDVANAHGRSAKRHKGMGAAAVGNGATDAAGPINNGG